jgi:hypothetical protein
MKGGFGDLTNHDFLRVNVDAPNLRVLNIDPPILTVDDFLTPAECDALIDAARSSGEMKVSAVGGTENQNIRTSKTCTLNSPALTDHPTKHAILAKAEALLPQLTGLSKSKGAFKAPTSGSPYSFELPQVAHYQGGEYFKTHEGEFILILVRAIGLTESVLFVYSVAGGRPGDVVGKRRLRATGAGTAGFIRHADGGGGAVTRGTFLCPLFPYGQSH